VGEIFFRTLAPKKRNPPKYQLEMAASVDSLKATMESMATQFKGFQDMMATSLDKLSALEAWWVIAKESMGTLLQRSTKTTARIKSLEFRPPPPPVQWQFPHMPPPPHPPAAGIDLNVAPGASSSMSPTRVDSPMGIDGQRAGLAQHGTGP